MCTLSSIASGWSSESINWNNERAVKHLVIPSKRWWKHLKWGICQQRGTDNCSTCTSCHCRCNHESAEGRSRRSIIERIDSRLSRKTFSRLSAKHSGVAAGSFTIIESKVTFYIQQTLALMVINSIRLFSLLSLSQHTPIKSSCMIRNIAFHYLTPARLP